MFMRSSRVVIASLTVEKRERKGGVGWDGMVRGTGEQGGRERESFRGESRGCP